MIRERTRLVQAVAVALALMLAAAQGRAQTSCIGDCTNTGQVTVADLVLGVNIVLDNQPASACPNLQNAQGNVDIVQLIEGVNNLLYGCPSPSPSPTPTPTPIFSGKQRRFVVAPGTPQMDMTATTTGLFSSGLSNANAATAVCGKLSADAQSCATPAELNLLLDDEDMGGGVHDLVLRDDVSLEIGVVDGSRICLKFLAAFTVGSVDCDGGTRYDIAATRPAGAPGVDFTYTRNLGLIAAAGNANLIVFSRYRIVPASDTTPCEQLSYTGTIDLPFTTTTATATISPVSETNLQLSVGGQAFSCDNFATRGSGGILTAPLPANQAPVGDVVNALRLGEAAP